MAWRETCRDGGREAGALISKATQYTTRYTHICERIDDEQIQQRCTPIRTCRLSLLPLQNEAHCILRGNKSRHPNKTQKCLGVQTTRSSMPVCLSAPPSYCSRTPSIVSCKPVPDLTSPASSTAQGLPSQGLSRPDRSIIASPSSQACLFPRAQATLQAPSSPVVEGSQILSLHLTDNLRRPPQTLHHLQTLLPPTDRVLALLEQIIQLRLPVHLLQQLTLHVLLRVPSNHTSQQTTPSCCRDEKVLTQPTST